MNITLKIGPTQGSEFGRIQGRAGEFGEFIVSQVHGRFFESAYRKTMFSAGNSASVTTTVGTATTYVGLVLANPNGSPVNLVPNIVSAAYNVAAATTGILGLMVGSSSTAVTLTTPAPAINNFIGVGPASQAVLASSATLPVTPTFYMPLAIIAQVTTVGEFFANTVTDLGGCLVIPPGSFVAFYTSAASTTFVAGIQWEEVPAV